MYSHGTGSQDDVISKKDSKNKIIRNKRTNNETEGYFKNRKKVFPFFEEIRIVTER